MTREEREILQNNPQLYHKYLEDLYSDKIVCGEKSSSELIEFLKKRFDAIECAVSDISPTYYRISVENVFHSRRNDVLNLQRNDLNFVNFIIPPVEKNKKLYDDAINRHLIRKNGSIVVLLETNTKYIATINQMVFLEMSIEKGISQGDFDNKTCDFYVYCHLLDEYAFSIE